MTMNDQTGGDQRRSGKGQRRPEATFRGETVEPRILLSATWDYVHQGTNGNDTLSGQDGDGLLLGGAGDDTLRGSLGDDDLRGGAGIDLIDYSIASSGIHVNLQTGGASGAFGNDTLSGIEVVRGSAFADRIVDSLGADTIHAGAGDDSLWTYGGADVIDGGAGYDTVHFTRATAVDVDVTITTEQETGGAVRKTFSNVEGFVGSWEDDEFLVSAPVAGAVYTIDGDAGNDRIRLTSWSKDQAVISANSVLVDMGVGQSFRVDFINIEELHFADYSVPLGGGGGIPPNAQAGSDQEVAEGAVVTLDASQTTAGGGGASRFTWIQVSGPVVTLDDEHAVKPTFTAPNVLDDAVIEFKLVVSDGDSVAHDMVQITVRGDDDAPLAYAGADQNAAAGQIVQLDAGLSEDPEGHAVTYTWVQVGGPPVTLSDPHAAQPTFTAPSGVDAAAVEFMVQVSDGTSVSSDRVTVTTAPIAAAGRWTFDEASGQTVLDSSGNGRHGVLGFDSSSGSPDPTRVVDGGRGRVLEFDGGDVVTGLGNGPAGDFAVSAWFRYDGTGMSWETIYSTQGYEIWLGIHHEQGFIELNIGASNAGVRTADGVVAAGQWQHVTATWDGSQGRIYIGGVDQTDHTFGTPTNPTAGAAQIGVAPSTSFEWHGRLDDVRVFDRSVTAADAAQLAGDKAPIADAGADRTVGAHEVVTLDATGSSDPEGRALTYRWIQTGGPIVALDNPLAATPTFTAPNTDEDAHYTFDVVVSDGFTCRVDSVSIFVEVENDNDPPTADAGSDQSVVEGDVVHLDGTGSADPEGATLTYSWTQISGPAVTLSDPTAAQPCFTAPELLEGAEIKFQLEVSDGVHHTTDVVTIQVAADDDAPVAAAGDEQKVNEGELVQLDGAGSSDPEGGTLTYEWRQVGGPEVKLTDASAALPEFTAPNLLEATDLQFELSVSDGVSTSTDTVTIRIVADNDAPVAVAGNDSVVIEGGAVRLNGAGSADPEGQQLTYEWTQVRGTAVKIADPTAASLRFVAPNLPADEELEFQLAVSDGVNRTIDAVSVVVQADDDAPMVEAGPDFAARGNAMVSLNAAGADPEGRALTYTWRQIEGPEVKLRDGESGRPTFVAPMLAGAATLRFEVGASDGVTTTYDTVEVAIAAATPPMVDIQAQPNVAAGEMVMIQAQATGGTAEPLRYTWMQMSGPQVQLMGVDQPQLMFLAPSTTRGGELVFQLQVGQGELMTTQMVSVFVDADAPRAASAMGAASATPAAPAAAAPVAAAPVAAAATAVAATAAVTADLAAIEAATAELTAAWDQRLLAAEAVLAMDGAGAADAGMATTGQSSESGALSAMLATDGATAGETTGEETRRMTFRTLNDAGRSDALAGDDEDDFGRDLLAEPADSAATAGSTKVLAPDLVVAESGNAITLQPRIPANAVGVDPATARWTQTGGTPIELDAAEGSSLHVRLPEVFVEEELVFQVELVQGDRRLVQEVSVQVQPVGLTNRALSIDDDGLALARADSDGDSDGAGRGVGRIWGAMIAFLGVQAGRRRSDA